MDMKENVGIYSEDAIDRALMDMSMWCDQHKDEFLDDAFAEAEALGLTEVNFDGMDDAAQESFQLTYCEWVMFDSKVFGHGYIDEYLDRKELDSEQDRAIIAELKNTQRFGFFRYEGTFDNGNGDKGIVVADIIDGGGSFKVYSTCLHDLAVERSFKPGTGLSARFAILGGRAYFVGQVPLHDKTMAERGETVDLYRFCREIGLPFILGMAVCVFSPYGMFNNSATINLK